MANYRFEHQIIFELKELIIDITNNCLETLFYRVFHRIPPNDLKDLHSIGNVEYKEWCQKYFSI